jgi:hypothetical protein
VWDVGSVNEIESTGFPPGVSGLKVRVSDREEERGFQQ